MSHTHVPLGAARMVRLLVVVMLLAQLLMAGLLVRPARAAETGPGLLISEYVANPASTDGSMEYVELLATRAIDFSVTPYSVVFSNNGTATANGWVNGGSITYGFSITSGTVVAGDVVYVGGSAMPPTGTKLRTIDNSTTPGDRFGSASSTGVLGNGGANADGIAVFDVGINALTSSTAPVDAIFFGTGIGTAVVSSGSAGYQLPVNDLYAGGKLQANSFFALEPNTSGVPTIATGTFSTDSGSFITARSWANATATNGASAITLSGDPVDTAPTVDQTAPANGAQNVALDADVEVVFDEAVTVQDGWYAISCTTSGAHTAAVGGGPITYTLDISGTLVNDESCTVTIESTLVADQDGTADQLAADYSWSFATVSANDAAPTIASTTPSSGATSVGVSSNIVITFSEPVTVTGTWYSISCSVSGDHAATASGGPTSYTLDPSANFVAGELCTVSVEGTLVTDQDGTPTPMVDGYSWSFSTPGLAIRPIGEVQGSVTISATARTHRSPYAGSGSGAGSTVVTVQGVVYELLMLRTSAGAVQRGFMLQNTAATADADPTTSDGIFVFMNTATTLAISGTVDRYTPQVGDEIILSGRVSENFNQTQFHQTGLALEGVVRGGVELDAALPAFVANPPDTIPGADLYWEQREGMRAAVPAASIVVSARTEFTSTADGEVWVINPTHPVAQRANAYERLVFRDPHVLDNNPVPLFDDANGYRILLGSLGVKGSSGDSFTLINAPERVLSTLGSTVTGGVYYAFSKYSVQPAQQPSYALGADPAASNPPQPADRAVEYAVASYNVENLYDYRDDPNDGCDFVGNGGCTGVNPPFNYVPASEADYLARLDGQADQIINDLRSPDILMIQEAEDQDICLVSGGALTCGTADNADGKPDTLQELALTIAAKGGPVYDAAFDRDGSDARGIVAAFLYRSDRVELPAPSASHPVLGSSPQVVYDGTSMPLDYNTQVSNPKALNTTLPSWFSGVPSSQKDGSNVFTRDPQVGLFRVWRSAVGSGDWIETYVIANHFSSTPDQRVLQRTEQANYLAAIVDAIQDAQPSARILAGGDFNVFPRPDDPFAPPNTSDQLGGLYDVGLENLYTWMMAHYPSSNYSYVFEGQAQTLDSMFVSAALSATLVDARVANINAGWTMADSGSTARGMSDHNPTVARFALRSVQAVDDAYSTAEDTPLAVAAPGVLGNDVSSEGDPLTATLVEDVLTGTLALRADGSLVYTPTLDFSGVVSFTYRAGDGQLSDTATVTITVTPVVDAPRAADDAYATAEDTPLAVDAPGVLGNDVSPEGDPLSATLVEDVLTGTLALRADGSLVYTPTLNFSGVVSFTYRASAGQLSDTATVTITVGAAGDAPTLTTISPLGPALPHRPYTITYEMLVAAADEADGDGDVVLFRVESLGNGTLTKGGAPVVAGVTTLGPGEALVFTPARGGKQLEAFRVVAYDGQSASTPPIPVVVSTRYASYAPVVMRT